MHRKDGGNGSLGSTTSFLLHPRGWDVVRSMKSVLGMLGGPWVSVSPSSVLHCTVEAKKLNTKFSRLFRSCHSVCKIKFCPLGTLVGDVKTRNGAEAILLLFLDVFFTGN